MINIDRICVAPDTSFRRVIEILNASGLQIVLIVDDQRRLVGTFTDGDLRRALLKGIALDDPVGGFFNAHPLCSPEAGGRRAAVALMREKGVDQVPVVDESRRVVTIESINPVRTGMKVDFPVVVMAGGLGKRLHPITESVPKALVSIGDKPILELIVERLAAQGFQRFIFAINHMGHMIEDYFGDGSGWNVNISYLREPKRLGTAGALSLCQPRPETPFIVTNCDVLTTTDFQSLLEHHMAEGAAATIGVREFSYQVPYGVLELEGSRVTGVTEKPTHGWHINAGIYVLEPSVIDVIPSGQRFDMTDVLSALLVKGAPVTTFMIRQFWIDIGEPDELESARAHYRARE